MLIKPLKVGKYIRRIMFFLLFFISTFFTQYSNDLPFTTQNLTYKHFLSDNVSEKSFKKLLELRNTNNILLNKISYDNFFKYCKEFDGFYAFSGDNNVVCTKKIWNIKYIDYKKFYGMDNINKLKNKTFYVIYLNRVGKNKKSVFSNSYIYEIFLNESKKIIFYSRVQVIELKRRYLNNIVNKLFVSTIVRILKYTSNLIVSKSEIYSKLYLEKYFPKYDTTNIKINFVNNDEFFDEDTMDKYRFAVLSLLRNKEVDIQLVINLETNKYFFVIKEVGIGEKIDEKNNDKK